MGLRAGPSTRHSSATSSTGGRAVSSPDGTAGPDDFGVEPHPNSSAIAPHALRRRTLSSGRRCVVFKGPPARSSSHTIAHTDANSKDHASIGQARVGRQFRRPSTWTERLWKRNGRPHKLGRFRLPKRLSRFSLGAFAHPFLFCRHRRVRWCPCLPVVSRAHGFRTKHPNSRTWGHGKPAPGGLRSVWTVCGSGGWLSPRHRME